MWWLMITTLLLVADTPQRSREPLNGRSQPITNRSPTAREPGPDPVTVCGVGARVDFAILGPLEIRIDSGEPLTLGGLRQRALLTILALHPNEVVSIDRLVDELWGENPPATAVHTVQVFVSRLRNRLGAAGERLVTRPPGYVLSFGADEIDAGRCEELYERARAALSGGRAAEAAALLRDAQALWRGPPLSEFTYEPFAQATIARLEELRLSCREELIDAELALGRHADVIPELEALVREQPFRERPRGQLMLALYRCGRQAEALEAFQQTRRMLVDELAVEPSGTLRELEQAILSQDASLEAPRPEPVAEPGPAPHDRASGEELPTVRKTATVLVAKLAASAHADPEVARRVFAGARRSGEEIVDRHGASFVGGLGGELVWVFGLPLVKEDDALRAIRAADDLRTHLSSISEPHPSQLTVRIGIATGEVVAEAATDFFGDPLDQAIALTAVAQDGEVLLGDATRRLASSSIRVESVLDGTAWRLREIGAGGPLPLRNRSPMVGRDEELASAFAIYGRATRSDEAFLLTVVGDAGIGKSRLARELAGRLADEATVLTGRCLSYGEGITFWPLREALTQAAGGESRDAIRGLVGDAKDADVVADIVATILGFGPLESVGEQVRWAFRRLLEELASRRPVMLVIEDAHWADPDLLDLIDYLVDWLKAPVLLLCLARPELLDSRPGWGGGRLHVSSLVLTPLRDEETLRLLEHRFADRHLSESESRHVLETAEGNPLFIEQLLQTTAENPWWDRESQIPATIQSLLAARLDRLGPGERAYIERAALIGREFWPSAVVELLPADAQPSAGQHLRSLVHRGLIEPDRSTLAGEEQLRFHHILIRDVAYRSAPKSARADLHERFARWLSQRDEQYDEFVGYHLEQAFHYRLELGQPGDNVLSLAERAGESLVVAGRRALSRGDANAGVKLLRNAAELFTASARERPEVLLDLGAALGDSGDFGEAERVLQAALEQANAARAASVSARALIELSFQRALVDPSLPVAEMLSVAERAIAVFKRSGDDGGIARAWHHVAIVHWIRSRGKEMEHALEQAMSHAERAGDRQMQSRILGYLARVTVTGPQPVEQGISRCRAILERAGDDIILKAVTQTMLAVLEAMSGRIDQARERWKASEQRLLDVGLSVTAAALQMYSAFIELLAETPENAEPGVREAYALLERIGEGHRRAMMAAVLARLLCAQGRDEESEHYTGVSEETASEDDIGTQVIWRGTRARVRARAGHSQLAEQLANSAVELAGDTDYLMLRGDALSDRAEVLAESGRLDAAERDLEQAITLYDQKGIGLSAGAARRRCQSLSVARMG